MHLHNFSVPVSADEPHARLCESCGERQVYRPPTGSGRVFTDVLVDKEDLRGLLDYYEGALEERGFNPDSDEAVLRVRALLDSADR